MEGGDPGQTASGIGQTVIAAKARDYLFLLRATTQIVVVADQLEVCVIGIGARGAKEHLGQMSGARFLAEEAQHAVGEPDDRLVRVRGEGVIIAEIAHRLSCGFSELAAAVADIDAPQAGAAIDELPAVAVLDPNPGAS